MADETPGTNPEFINPLERQQLHRQLVDGGLAVPIWHVANDGTRFSMNTQPGESDVTVRSHPQEYRTLLGISMPLGEGEYLIMSTQGLEEVVIRPDPRYAAQTIKKLDLDNADGFQVSEPKSSVLANMSVHLVSNEIITYSHSTPPEEFRTYYERAVRCATETRTKRNQLATTNAHAGQNLLQSILES